MSNLEQHYKERQPEETVKIIQDFFLSNNYILKETHLSQTEAGTWYNHIDLFKGDVKLGGANGKGMTENYCRASGYAELYERFCNRIMFSINPYWNKAVQDANFKKHGYYYHPEERLLSYDELRHCCRHMNEYISYLTSDNDVLTEKALNFITDNKPIGVPMYSIANKEDKIYMDPRLLIRLNHSMGMTAGNTLEEALNQGISEVVEMRAEYAMYQDWTATSYCALNLDKIENPSLQQIIQNIKKEGYDLYLIDLSYTYETPVMMSLLVDKNNNTINFDVGAFPVFDIAAERVLTELYQGINTFHSGEYKTRVQLPFRSVFTQEIYRIYGNHITGVVFPLEFFKNLQYKDTYNHDVYIAPTTDNHKILQYFIELSKKQNYTFYYMDNSLSDKVYAVHIFCDGDCVNMGEENFPSIWDKVSVQRAILTLQQYRNLYDGLLDNNVNYSELIELISSFDVASTPFFGAMNYWNDCHILGGGSILQSLIILFNNAIQDLQNISDNFIGSIIEKPLKKYMTLKAYMLSGQYSSDEILEIFNNIFNFNITLKDIQNYNNISYLLFKSYVEPLQLYFKGKQFGEIIDTYT